MQVLSYLITKYLVARRTLHQIFLNSNIKYFWIHNNIALNGRISGIVCSTYGELEWYLFR